MGRREYLEDKSVDELLRIEYKLLGGTKQALIVDILQKTAKKPSRIMTPRAVELAKAEVDQSYGRCSICGKVDELYAGTCEDCFIEWMKSVYE